MKILSKKEAEQVLVHNMPQDIKILKDIFVKAGFDLMLVGGSVRDSFLNKIPKDFDVCTNAMPEQVMEILTKENIRFQLQGEAFGVVVAKMTEEIEIATFRTDVSAMTGRNNDDSVILGVTIEEDVKRRDLTINALFMDIANENIIDLVGGIADLNNHIIRTVGNPSERFAEDNLRKLRAIRFATRLGFDFDPETFQAIQNDPKLNVSEERVVNELFNAFTTTKNVGSLVLDLMASGLHDEILSGISTKVIFTPKDIDVTKITSFSTFIAEMISFDKEDTKELEKKLIKRKFDTKTINNIIFLKKFDNVSTIDPTEFISKRKSTSLSNDEIITFHKGKFGFQTLCEFKLPEGLSQELMDKGFTGKELGTEIKRIAAELLQSKLKKLF